MTNFGKLAAYMCLIVYPISKRSNWYMQIYVKNSDLWRLFGTTKIDPRLISVGLVYSNLTGIYIIVGLL